MWVNALLAAGESKHNLAFLLMDLAKSLANILAIQLNSQSKVNPITQDSIFQKERKMPGWK